MDPTAAQGEVPPHLEISLLSLQMELQLQEIRAALPADASCSFHQM